MKVNYNIWKNGQRSVRVSGTDQDPASGYNEDAENFITTGNWGALDPEKNKHLFPYRAEFLSRLKTDHVDELVHLLVEEVEALSDADTQEDYDSQFHTAMQERKAFLLKLLGYDHLS